MRDLWYVMDELEDLEGEAVESENRFWRFLSFIR